MERRQFITGLAGIFAASQAPWICTTSGILMPTKKVFISTTTTTINTKGMDLIIVRDFTGWRILDKEIAWIRAK